MTTVKFTTTTGDITLELDNDKAPSSCENFVKYVEAGHYDGTIFHRVIEGFMVQGGGFNEKGIQKKTRSPIKNEADNGLKNDRGTIAMARTMEPHSASAQFFINLVDNNFLNFKSPNPAEYGYAVFGKVTEGMEVVDKIGATVTGAKFGFGQDCPADNITITSAKVL